MQTNVKTPKSNLRTHEGAPAVRINAIQELRRSVLACLLWEKEFYESGVSIADRIAGLVPECKPEDVATLVVEARTNFNLRHVPLFLTAEMTKHERHKPFVADTINSVVRRADEMGELLAMLGVNRSKRTAKIPAQVKKGLARVFTRFDEHQLAKYNRDSVVRLRDVLFLTHPKPKDDAQAALWKRLVDNQLATPDTWEVSLSAGADKKATWERLIAENNLGYLALLRNLRNMDEAGVDAKLIDEAILARRGAERVLPFRFVAAAKAAPRHEPALDEALVAGLSQVEKLPGKTIVVIDVSGSMYHSRLSAKSDMDRAQAACALGAICREMCETPRIYATAGSDYTRKHDTREVPARRGMALVDAIHGLSKPLGGGGIFLKQVMDFIYAAEKEADRVIVITDEQDCGIDSEDSPLKARLFTEKNYMINVASNKNGVGYGRWTHFDGFSESVLTYIREHEKQ